MKRYLKWCLMLIVAVVAVGFAGCRNKKDDLNDIGQDLSNYYMNIEYDNTNKTLYAQQTLDYVNNSDAILSEIYMHLYVANFCQGAVNKPVEDMNIATAYPNGVSYASLNIVRVKLNDKDIMPKYEGEDNDIMKISLSQNLEPTERAEVYIEYQISIPNLSHRFGYTDSGVNIANFYPVACVYDDNGWSKNPYHFNGDPFYSEMANYYVTFECDSNLTCAFTGNSECSIEDGKSVYTINSVCVREFAIMLSDKFQTLTTTNNGVKYNYYYLNDNSPDKALQCAVDAINTFSAMFYPYPYQYFNVVQSSFLHGGMEYPMLVLISDDIEDYDDYLNVIVHETAHQWWYSLVGNDQYSNPWLDEALTEYSTLLFYDNNKGYNLNHAEMINGMQTNYNTFVTVYTDVLGSVDTSINRNISEYNTSPEYTYCVYVKGTLMFDSLNQLIGAKKMVKALKLYAETYAYKISTPECLIACFEQVTNSNLSNFFDSWLTGKVVIH